MHNPTTELTSSVEGYGDIVIFGTGNTWGNNPPGLLYYLDNSGDWVLTDAGGSTKSTSLIAIALGSQPLDGMLIKGYAINNDWAGFGIGVPLYLVVEPTPAPIPSLAGTISDSPPTGSGEIIRIVGHSINTGSEGIIYFNPSNDWIVI